MDKLYIDPIIKPELVKIKKRVRTQDFDWFAVVDGEEGSGKSVLAMQLAKELDPNFGINNICYTSDQFQKAVRTFPKFSAIIFDETYSSASSRSAMSEINKSLVTLGTEMRQKNLFIILVLPSFFDLDKYFALHRCKCLFHVVFTGKEKRRGSYYVYPRTAKKLLYLYGKKTYNYTKPKSPIPRCRFFKYYPIDEKEYRTQKSESFVNEKPLTALQQKWKDQRDGFVRALHNKYHLSGRQISELVKSYGNTYIDFTIINDIVAQGRFEGDGTKDNNKNLPPQNKTKTK